MQREQTRILQISKVIARQQKIIGTKRDNYVIRGRTNVTSLLRGNWAKDFLLFFKFLINDEEKFGIPNFLFFVDVISEQLQVQTQWLSIYLLSLHVGSKIILMIENFLFKQWNNGLWYATFGLIDTRIAAAQDKKMRNTQITNYVVRKKTSTYRTRL